jgi:hypothetical protein
LQEPLVILEMEPTPCSRSQLVRLRDPPDCEPKWLAESALQKQGYKELIELHLARLEEAKPKARDDEIDRHLQLEIARYRAYVSILETQDGLSSEHHSVATDETRKLEVLKEVVHRSLLSMDDKLRILRLPKHGLSSKQIGEQLNWSSLTIRVFLHQFR